MKRREDFLEDYSWLRSCGYTHEQIAERFGIKRDSLETALRRAGFRIPEPSEVAIERALDWLIAGGRPFTAEALPYGDSVTVAGGALKRAVHAGRIAKVGRAVSHYTGHPIALYRAATAELEASA